jgi:hypothetical protein
MLELVLLTGTIVALSFGLALIALILRNAVRKSRKPRKSPDIKPVNVFHDANSLDSIQWELALRGYDTPELCREDRLARRGALPDEDRF